MVIFPLAPGQTIAQMWSNGARGGGATYNWIMKYRIFFQPAKHATSNPLYHIAGAAEMMNSMPTPVHNDDDGYIQYKAANTTYNLYTGQ